MKTEHTKEMIEQMVEALEAALKYMPSSTVHNWPPGYELKREAIQKCRAALQAAKGAGDVG